MTFLAVLENSPFLVDEDAMTALLVAVRTFDLQVCGIGSGAGLLFVVASAGPFALTAGHLAEDPPSSG